MMLFTDFVPDLEVQSYLGWSLNGCLFLMFLINLVRIIYNMTHKFRLLYKKGKNRALKDFEYDLSNED